MFQKLWGMLCCLEEAKGANAKKALLKSYVDDIDFVWMAKNALDQGHSFGVNEFPEYTPALPYKNSAGSSVQFVALKEAIHELKRSAGVTDAMLDKVHLLACTSEAAYNVTLRILRKDLRCGVGAKTINGVKKGIIFTVPYQRCGSGDKAEKFDFGDGAVLQRKANGMFTYLMPDGTFITRQGETSRIEGNLISPFVASLPILNQLVTVQELVIIHPNGIVMDRAESNGLINSFFQGEGDPAVAPMIRACTWLCLPEQEFRRGESSSSYKEIWNALTRMIPIGAYPIQPIESWYVKNLDEAMYQTRLLIRAGEEGAVLKSLGDSFIWKDQSSSNYQLKLKAQATCEFEIIGAYEGDPNKKYAGMLGGITIRSKDGKIVSDCGGGFTDKQRAMGVDYWNALTGGFCSVTFNGITKPNENGVCSLDHPRFEEVRIDKAEADTLEYCQKALLGVVDNE